MVLEELAWASVRGSEMFVGFVVFFIVSLTHSLFLADFNSRLPGASQPDAIQDIHNYVGRYTDIYTITRNLRSSYFVVAPLHYPPPPNVPSSNIKKFQCGAL